MEETQDTPTIEQGPTATRKDLHLTRRFFHFSMGLIVGLVYQFFLTHSRAIYILGICACVVYILEQVRINYPNLSNRISLINRSLFRAEEQLRESAGVPFVMGVLLTLISFPKVIALVSIYTLALADPLSAIIGIRYGKIPLMKNKSLQGSLAFFFATFLICFTVFFWWTSFLKIMIGTIILLSFLTALTSSIFELVPLKLDDNLTIPLFTSAQLWIWCILLDIPT